MHSRVGSPVRAWLAAIVVAISSTSASADPPTCKSEVHEIAAGGYHEIFATMLAGPRGLDLFWRTSKTNVDPEERLVHATMSATGEQDAGPATAIEWGRRVAVGEPGTYAIVNGHGFDVHVSLVTGSAHDKRWDAELPHREFGYETVALLWDPRHGDWIIVAETHDAVAGRQGVTHRLLEGRLDAHDGGWLQELAPLSPEGVDAEISDIGAPLAWAGDHAVLAWTGDDVLYVTEFLRAGPNRRAVAQGHRFFRASIAATSAGIVIAGEARDSGRVFVAGLATPLRFVSAERTHGSEVALASDGSRVAIAWDVSEPKANGSFVHTAVIDAHGELSTVFESQRGTWMMVQGLAWTSCGLAVLYTTRLDTPDDRMELAVVAPSSRAQLAR